MPLHRRPRAAADARVPRCVLSPAALLLAVYVALTRLQPNRHRASNALNKGHALINDNDLAVSVLSATSSSVQLANYVWHNDVAGGVWHALLVGEMLARELPCVSQPSGPPARTCATAVFAFTKVTPQERESWTAARQAHGRDMIANTIAQAS